MKTKKTVIAALTAALLVSAILITGCMDQIVEKSDNDTENGNYKVPKGKSLVRFKISDSNARTILPGVGGVGIQLDDMFYDVIFSSTTAGGGTVELAKPNDGSNLDTMTGDKLTYSDITGPISLTPGDYFVLLRAFADKDGDVLIAKYQSPAEVNFPDGDTVSVSVKLIGIVDGEDEGILSYVANIHNDYTTQTLDIFEADGSTIVSSIDLTSGGGTGTTNLDSGYYIVKITASRPKHITNSITDAVHIYPAMTSIISFTASSAPVQNQFDVSFNLNSNGL